MKKNKVFVSLVIALVVMGLVACNSEIVKESSVSTTSTEVTTLNVEDNSESFVPDETENIEDSNDELYQTYFDAIYRLINCRLLPYDDERELEFMDYSMVISDNEFSIYDVDFDGVEELIINWTTSSMAGRIYQVLEYDVDSEEWNVELNTSSKPDFYSNGVAIEESLHNQGWAYSIWPYIVFQYSVDNDTYEEFGSVTCWDSFFTEDIADVDFPYYADTDEVNVVYMINCQGYEEEYYSQSAYDEFWNGLIDDSEIIQIPYYSLTVENAELLTNCSPRPIEVLSSLPDGDYMVTSYSDDAYNTVENYSFSEDGLSGTFYVYEYVSFSQEYIESLEVGDVIEQPIFEYEDVVINHIDYYDDNVYINSYNPDASDSYLYSYMFFQRQENGMYYLRGATDEIDIRPIGMYRISISENVEIYDNAVVFGASVPTYDSESSYVTYINNISEFVEIINSDCCWSYPTLFIRVVNGEISLISINPNLHQPWRAY